MFSGSYFRMMVEDVFAIRNRGTVVTGRIESGAVSVGHEIYVHRADLARTAIVSGIEMYRKSHQRAETGDVVGLILTGIEKEDIQRGDILSSQSRLD